MDDDPLQRCLEILRAAPGRPPDPATWRALTVALEDLVAAMDDHAGSTLDALATGRRAGPGPDDSASLRRILDSVDSAVIAIDADGGIRFANQAAAAMLGEAAERLVGRRLDDAVEVSARTPDGERMERLPLHDAQPHCRQDVEVSAPDGRRFDASYTLVPLPEPVDGRVLLLRDRSEDKAREARLKLTQFSVEGAGDPIFWVALDGRLMYANRAACASLGFERDELLKLHVSDISGEVTPELWPQRRQLILDHGCVTFDTTHRRRDGSLFPVEVTANHVQLDGAEYLCAFARDVTERRRQEDALRGAKASAEAANRAKTEFLANMSHEIRTPMTAILGYADVLAEPDLDDDRRVESVGAIRRNGEHLLALLNDILDISKIEAGKMTVERIECRLEAIVRDVESMMRLRAEDKGLSFGVRFDTPAPEAIHTDPTRLRQILINLIGNAVKFTERGGVDVAISFDGDPAAPRWLRVAVADTGCGVTREQMSRLFRPFSQADTSTTRRFGGAGLGLAISRRLAEALGGRLEVESEPGRGSVFTLSLDVGPVAGELTTPRLGGRPGGGTAAPPTESPRLSGRVLVAEDGEDNQRLIQHFLSQAGADVVVVGAGDEAVQRATEAMGGQLPPFDLILMDMQLPQMDGYDASRALRRAGWAGPILALTAHALPTDRDRCLAAGCDDHLTKPIRRAVLLRACARWMERRADAA